MGKKKKSNGSRRSIYSHTTPQSNQHRDTMNMKMFSLPLLLLLLLGGAASVTKAQDCTTIAELAVAANLTTLAALADAAGLIPLLSNASTAVTVLAPSDDAFAFIFAAFDTSLEEVLGNATNIDFIGSFILPLHVLPAPVRASELVNEEMYSTLLTLNPTPFGTDDPAFVPAATELTAYVGETVSFSPIPSPVNATVISADNVACSSIVHIIDAVLFPPFEDDIPDVNSPDDIEA